MTMTTTPAAQIMLANFARDHPAADKQLRATACSHRTCRAYAGMHCKTPSGRPVFYHRERQIASGVYDNHGDMYDWWKNAGVAPSSLPKLLYVLKNLERHELRELALAALVRDASLRQVEPDHCNVIVEMLHGLHPVDWPSYDTQAFVIWGVRE